MPIVAIPTSDHPFYSQSIRLDGRDYILSFAYNQREERWYLSLADDEGVPIVSGLKLQTNWPLLHRYSYDTRLPPGELLALATTPDDSPPTLLELGEGKRVRLIYFDAAWIAEFRAGAAGNVLPLPVYIAVRVTPLGGYAGDLAYATAVAVACAGLSVPGRSVTTGDVLSAAVGIPGATVTGLAIGIGPPSPGPVTIIASTISVGANQRPSFSGTFINVVSV